MEQKCAGCGSTKVEKCNIEGASIRLEQASTLKKVFSVGTVISTEGGCSNKMTRALFDKDGRRPLGNLNLARVIQRTCAWSAG
mgnify:CR=1 FL=1